MPFAVFEEMWRALYPDHFNLLLTVNADKCIGGEAFFLHQPSRSVYQTYIGLDRNVGTQYRTYFFLSWGLIKWAEENGFSLVTLSGLLLWITWCSKSPPR